MPVLEPNEFLSTWLVLVIWVTPLLFPLKGILQGNPYTHAWANFILIFLLPSQLNDVVDAPR